MLRWTGSVARGATLASDMSHTSAAVALCIPIDDVDFFSHVAQIHRRVILISGRLLDRLRGCPVVGRIFSRRTCLREEWQGPFCHDVHHVGQCEADILKPAHETGLLGNVICCRLWQFLQIFFPQRVLACNCEGPSQNLDQLRALRLNPRTPALKFSAYHSLRTTDTATSGTNCFLKADLTLTHVIP